MKTRLYTKQVGESLLPIFMVHGDEANGLIPKFLNSDIPFHAFYHPYNQNHTAKYISFEEYASNYIIALKKLQPDGPYILAGYSIGGIIAFEIAHQLKDQGEKVECLILLDSRAPGLIGNRDLHNRQIKWNEKQPIKGLKKLYKKSIIKGCLLLGKKIPDKQLPFFLMQRYRKARGNYDAQPFNGDIHLLRSKVDNFENPHLGWAPYSRGNIFIHPIEGNHHQVTIEPAVIQVSKVVEEIYWSKVSKHATIS